MAKRRRKARYKVRGKLGTGTRSKRLARSLRSRRGKRKVRSVGGLIHYIGVKKYGRKRFAKLAARGRHRAAARRKRRM
jgi:hypothetical protein